MKACRCTRFGLSFFGLGLAGTSPLALLGLRGFRDSGLSRPCCLLDFLSGLSLAALVSVFRRRPFPLSDRGLRVS